MNSTGLLKYAAACLALATCSGCGGSSAVAPASATLDGTYVGRTLSVNGRLITAARLGARPRFATILPERHTKSNAYEYIINLYGSYADIFDYPASDKQIGTINDVGGQGCTNVLYGYGKKIFWIVAGAHQISEYQVPHKLIKNLSVSYSTLGPPSSCAMDTSGDLAVGILSGTGGGDVVIFKNAAGAGVVYTTPLDEEFFDGYDNQGNLFADGFSGDRSGFTLAELPKGSSKFETITTSNTVNFPGSVQWDGKYLTVVDQDADAMYRYTVSGTKATLTSTVSLSNAGDCAQTWIAGSVVFCANADGNGEVYKYPDGGSAIATLTGDFDEPLGTVAAKK